jgi:hypothetical protein
MARRTMIALVLIAVCLHAWAISRTIVPAQDGLKFLRASRSFESQAWHAAIRGTDQHPLYPMLVASARPMATAILGAGPESERIAAQAVSSLAAVATLLPLYFLARSLHGALAACLTALLYVALPLPAEIGHDCLSDSLGLFFTVSTLCLGASALRRGDRRLAVAAGVCAGLGYWARPEVVLAGGAVLIVAIADVAFGLRHHVFGRFITHVRETGPEVGVKGGTRGVSAMAAPGLVPALLLAACVPVGGYALAKGQISEKLSVRMGIGLGPAAVSRVEVAPRPRVSVIPPKEEPSTSVLRSPRFALGHIGRNYVRVIGLFLAPLALVGAMLSGRSAGQVLIKVYFLLFLALLVRHVTVFGYGSYRHVLSLVVVSLPWAAWRLSVLGRRMAGWFRVSGAPARVAGFVCCGLILCLGIVAQGKAVHPSRWGHWAAGQWLARETGLETAVLDTHGWAGFIARRRTYDMWHVGQALSDARLRHMVVERAEVEAATERGRSLRTLIDERARSEPIAAFPARKGGTTADVLIYEVVPRSPAAEGGS